MPRKFFEFVYIFIFSYVIKFAKKECFTFMTIKQMWKELLNKKWNSNDLFRIVASILIASFITTPILGIPIGILVYFLLFYKDEDIDEMAEKYDYQGENKK